MDEGIGVPRDPGQGGLYLVAVSGSVNSEYLIRWTAAMAQRLGASWAAIHVRLSAEERPEAAAELNLELARSLGGEAVSIPGEDVALGLIQFARIRGAGTIVIGKASEAGVPFRGKRSVMDAILAESGELDVIALRGRAPVPPPRRNLRLRPGSTRDYLVALGSILGITGISLAAQPALGYRAVSLLYLLAIILLPFICGRGAVVAGAFLSALLWNFVFIPPRFTFSIASLEDFLMFAAFFLAAFVGGVLTSRLKEKEAALSFREKRMALLYGFTRSLTRVHGVEAVLALGAAYVAEHLDGRVAVWLRRPEGGLGRRWEGDGADTLGRLRDDRARECFEARAARLDEPGLLYLPLGGADALAGVIGVLSRDGTAFQGESRELLATIVSNMALALEREFLAAEKEAHKLVAESERLSRILLDHVSHELRTPLTTIKGSISSLVDGSVEDDPLLRAELLAETLKAADTLNFLVEDLLSMSRLEAGALRLRPERVYFAELLGAAQASLAGELAGRSILIDPACADLELEVDPALMVQVFRNLLRNYARHTPPGTKLWIEGREEGEATLIRFVDDGPGVASGELGLIFDTFMRGSRSGSHQGSGLGLAICRGILEAHRGTIRAEDRSGGGLAISLRVPGGKP